MCLAVILLYVAFRFRGALSLILGVLSLAILAHAAYFHYVVYPSLQHAATVLPTPY